MKKLDYVDLFVLPVPKKNLAKYLRSAKVFSKLMRENGVKEYREFVGDDLHVPGMTSITHDVKVKKDEVLVGAYVVYCSRVHRDRVNKIIMSDPLIAQTMKEPIFDMKRMLYGGFKTIFRI